MYKNLTLAAILGFLAVILGAFGAHALKSRLSPEALQSFETGVRYQMYHAIVLLIVNGFQKFSAQDANIISLFFFFGILFFSGSIYLIHLTNISAKSIWFVTPFGGILLIVGWALLAYKFFKIG